MTTNHSASPAAAPDSGVAARPSRPATVVSRDGRDRRDGRRLLATAVTVASVVAVVLWGVLATVNGRGLGVLVTGNEATSAIVGLSFAVVGGFVLRRAPGHTLGWIFAVEGLLQASSEFGTEYAYRTPQLPLAGVAAFVGAYAWAPGMIMGASLITPLFPDGRPASRRWRPLVWAGIAATLAGTVSVLLTDQLMRDAFPQWHNPLALPASADATIETVAMVALALGAVCGLIGAGALAVRMARATDSERRRIGWFFVAFTVGIVAQFLDTVSPVIPLIAWGLFPAALGVAMLRHGLFDGDRLLNRTLVYATITILVAGVFGLAVGLAGSVVGGSATGAVLAAVVIALGLAPARDLVQRGVDRLLYGQRRDPYAALSGLGRQLSAAIAPEDVLPIICRTVCVALRLPYAAVTLDGEAVPAAIHGTVPDATVEIPLHHAGTAVGRLSVGLPAGQRFLDPNDERLLLSFAQQAAVASERVRLTHDLRRSRDSLAVARDEERHRIRRDLHDGLGPTLAGVALGLGAAKRSVAQTAPDTAELLGHLEIEVRDSLDDVKRLVADLRPTALEQIGLVEALRQYADTVTLRSQGSLKVRIDAGPLPALSGDVEVAAYRIVLEAVTNVSRHAEASHCVVTVAPDDEQLRLLIADNGVGIKGTPQRPGLGLRSMVERATELGGSCTVSAGAPTGTVVMATLPFVRPQ
jgi:two-component system NarL family sensor kinase